MTLETALKAASMQRMPTPKTTEGMPPSAAMAAVGVMRTAGTAAPAAISRGVPRSCACGPGAPRKATLRSATNATSATHSVISLDERAMAKPLQSWQSKTHPHLSRKWSKVYGQQGMSLRSLRKSSNPQQNCWLICCPVKQKAVKLQASPPRTDGMKRDAVSCTQPKPELVMMTTWLPSWKAGHRICLRHLSGLIIYMNDSEHMFIHAGWLVLVSTWLQATLLWSCLRIYMCIYVGVNIYIYIYICHMSYVHVDGG